MKVPGGDDTQFIIDLGNRYSFKRMVLNSFMCDNLFQNFYDNFTDFSIIYDVGAGPVNLTITCNQFLTQNQFLTWFNQQLTTLAPGTIQLQNNPNGSQIYEYKLSYQTVNAAHTWTPRGIGWIKLGFDNTFNRQRTHTAVNVYDFTQSPTILIRFDNLPNAYITKYGQFTFQVENNSSFGGKIMKIFESVATNQQLLLNTSSTINQLYVTLLNADLQKIRTVNGNNNFIECVLGISLYDE